MLRHCHQTLCFGIPRHVTSGKSGPINLGSVILGAGISEKMAVQRTYITKWMCACDRQTSTNIGGARQLHKNHTSCITQGHSNYMC